MTAPRRLLLFVTLALLGGQLLGRGPVIPLAGSMAGAAALVLAIGRASYAWIALCLCATAIGALQVAAVLAPRLPVSHVINATGRPLTASGRVHDCAPDAVGRTRLTIDLDAITDAGVARPASGRALITIERATVSWEPGDRVRAAPLRFRRPRNFGNPGEFDYEGFLARRRIYVTAFAMSDAGWGREPAPATERRVVARWRTAIRAALHQSLGGVARAITAALIIGDTAPLPATLWERYARTGVAHVLSISGLHITLVASAAYGAARWLLSRSQWLLLRANVPKLSMMATIVPVGLYGLLAGGSAPTLRAIAVVFVFGAGLLLNRRRDWLTSLAAAALFISIAWPGAIFEISFQLSFMSVVTIMGGMQPIVARWRAWEEARLIRLRPEVWRWRILRAIALTIATTTCAVVGTAPLTAYHFNQISLITWIANLLVVPLLGLVPISAGLLAALCVPVAPAVAAALFQLGGLFIECADWLVAVLARVPGAAVRTVTPTTLELLLLYAALGSARLLMGRRRTLALVVCGALLLGDAGYWCWERFLRSRLRVTFLSVGQGDCAVVEFPGARVWVIDGGGLAGSFDVGERVVAPFLWRRKIRRVDALVLSHAEHDHYGGLAFLARSFAPGALVWNGREGEGRALRQFWAAVAQQGVAIQPVHRGFATRLDGVDVEVLAPEADASGSLNDQSLVLRLRYGATAMLFTGDLEADGERRLVTHAADDLPAAVLKVPHHGSRTSSSDVLLRAVRPDLAIISAGFANRFRMPHPDVLARYAAHHTAVWRTDLHGAVVVTVAADGAITASGTRGPVGSGTGSD